MASAILPGVQVELRDSPSAGYKRLAVFRHAAVRASYQVGQVDQLELVLDFDDPAVQLLLEDPHATERYTLRTQRPGAHDVEMWEVTGVQRARGEDGSLSCEVSARALWGQLDAGMVVDVLDETVLYTFGRYYHTPSELAQLLIDSCDSPVLFELGAVLNDAEIELVEFADETPLEGLWKLEAAAKLQSRFTWSDAIGDHGGYEVVFEDSQVLHFDGATIRTGANLQALRREDDHSTGGTRFYGVGADGLTLADADWIVESASGDELVLTDDSGLRGPVFAASWLVGVRVRKSGDTGAGQLVTATAGSLDSPAVLTIPGLVDLTAGDRVELVDARGRRLGFVDHPSISSRRIIPKKIDATDTPRHGNLIRNPLLEDWPDDQELPSHWSLIGTPFPQRILRRDDPVNIQYGRQALKITASGLGQGVRSSAFTWRSTTRLPIVAYVSRIITIGGAKVQMYLESVTDLNAQGNPLRYPLNQTLYADHGTALDPYVHDLAAASSEYPVPDGEYTLCLEATGPGEWMLNAATASPTEAGNIPQAIASGGPQALWRHVCEVANQENTPIRTYAADLLNLYRLNPTAYAAEKLLPGRAVRIWDEQLREFLEVRVTRLQERLDAAEAEGSVELSNERRDVRILAPKGTRSPGRPGVPQGQGDQYEWGEEGACGVGFVTITHPDGVRVCVPEDQVLLPAAAPVAAFDPLETDTPGTLLLDASASTGRELRYVWTVGIHTPPPPVPTFTMDPAP